MKNDGVHWEPEEDDLLLKLVSAKGTRWSIIVTLFNLRTVFAPREAPSLRNRFKRLSDKSGAVRQHCSFCGQPRRAHICHGRALLRRHLLKRGFMAMKKDNTVIERFTSTREFAEELGMWPW